jgi:hypothetical protein
LRYFFSRLHDMHAIVLVTVFLAVLIDAAHTASAQSPNFLERGEYTNYPQTRGKVQDFEFENFPAWLTLDMQIRLRTEDQAGYQYTFGNNRIYELTRLWGGATVRPLKWLTGYMQFMDDHALGLPVAHQNANMRDNFDLRQGYLELHGGPVQLYAGRRELRFGNERVVGISDYTNNSRRWDGFFGHLADKTNENALDVFSTSVVVVKPESLDKHGAGLTFHGVYGTLNSWIPGGITLQPFVLVKALPRVESPRGIFGSETEVTFGAESTGKFLGNFNYDVLADLQRGSYSDASIHGGADVEKIGYTFRNLPWKPRLGGEYDYATGNPHNNLDRIKTYDQQYPSNHNAFGFSDLFGFQNIKQQRVNLDLGPTKNLTLLVQGEAIGVASRRDNIYNDSGTTAVAVPSRGFATNSIGDGFDLSSKYVFHDYLVFNAAFSHFFPSNLMSAAKKGAPLTYSMFSLTYRFRVDR